MTSSPDASPAPGAPSRDRLAGLEQAYRSVTRRLIPFLFVCFIVASMDRINVSFAKAQLGAAIGLSDAMYGLGAGLFFIGYIAVEIPSNVLLLRYGARRWIARIMVSWGIVSLATAWVSTPHGFYLLRVLLGVCEAGFAPGVMFYLTQWYPPQRRGRVLAIFLVSLPLSGVIAAPVSGLILGTMDGAAGLAGWQWMFILESLPAIGLGLLALTLLPDAIGDAHWLGDDARRLLSSDLEPWIHRERFTAVATALGTGLVWLLGAAYLLMGMGVFGLTFWLPTLLRGAGALSPSQLGTLAMLPYLAGAASMVVLGRRADAHPGHAARLIFGAAATGALGLALSLLFTHSVAWVVVTLCLAAAGVFATVPIFWKLATARLTGAIAAAAIAIVNSIGSFSGFLGPYVVGVVKEATGAMTGPILLLSALLLFGAMLLYGLQRSHLASQAA